MVTIRYFRATLKYFLLGGKPLLEIFTKVKKLGVADFDGFWEIELEVMVWAGRFALRG